jgi:hypothetical protein
MLLALEQTPHDPFTRAASFSLFFFVIDINCIWIVIKLELWSNGYRGWLPKADVREFRLLSDRQVNPSKRLAYNVIYYAWHACFILLFVVPLTLLGIGYLLSRAH